jgi:serine/threonine protein kinase
MAFTVVQEVGSKAASVVLQVVKQLPAWVTTLSPTTFEAAGVSLPPAPSGWELGAAGLGLPPAVTYALPLGSGQTVARQYALKISQPWELSDSYQQDSSLEGREKYLQAVNRRMAQEERVIKRVHAAPNNHSSQHVIQCYGRGWVELPGCDYPLPALLLEYYPGGSLEDMGPLDADDAGWHLAQVAQGLMALQAAGIAHTNLHPSHCIIDELGDVNLCGFGCAEELGVGALTGFTPGPRLPGYTPAELAPDCKHDITVDVWALGGLLVRLRSGEDPEGLVEGQPDQLNGQKVYNLPSRYSQLLTEEEQSLVMDCLKPCYARPTATKLWDRHVGYFDRHY